MTARSKKRGRRALITGITGQDGFYLADLLLKKGYEVFGLYRRTSNNSFVRLDTVPHLKNKIRLICGNLRDLGSVREALRIAHPDEVYNLAAQSHVALSFHCPEETMEINYYGVGRLVNEALTVNPHVKIYQASTSEMFGAAKSPQNEKTQFQPVSPYAEAKVKAYEDFVLPYRERGAFICSGFLFNHESPHRGENFVTRKIIIGLSKVKLGLEEHLELGNLDSRRDWGFAGDYVRAMWLMLQQKRPLDFVIATGKSHTVRDFVDAAARALDMPLTWKGKGVKEVGMSARGETIVKVNPEFYRPTDPENLRGDARLAGHLLGWQPEVSFEELVKMMAEEEFARLSAHIR